MGEFPGHRLTAFHSLFSPRVCRVKLETWSVRVIVCYLVTSSRVFSDALAELVRWLKSLFFLPVTKREYTKQPFKDIQNYMVHEKEEENTRGFWKQLWLILWINDSCVFVCRAKKQTHKTPKLFYLKRCILLTSIKWSHFGFIRLPRLQKF